MSKNKQILKQNKNDISLNRIKNLEVKAKKKKYTYCFSLDEEYVEIIDTLIKKTNLKSRSRSKIINQIIKDFLDK